MPYPRSGLTEFEVIAGRIAILETSEIQRKPSTDGPTVLTRKEAAERLKISQSMLDILTKQGKIAVCRIGRRRLFTTTALAEYVSRTETKTRDA